MKKDIRGEIFEWLAIIAIVCCILAMLVATYVFLTQEEKKPLTEEQRTITIKVDGD